MINMLLIRFLASVIDNCGKLYQLVDYFLPKFLKITIKRIFRVF